MTDQELAAELVRRLNALIENHDARKALAELITNFVVCSASLGDHPTIQVIDEGELCAVGFLGMLNGVVGVAPRELRHGGYGWITAVWDGHGRLLRFQVTGEPEIQETRA